MTQTSFRLFLSALSLPVLYMYVILLYLFNPLFTLLLLATDFICGFSNAHSSTVHQMSSDTYCCLSHLTAHSHPLTCLAFPNHPPSHLSVDWIEPACLFLNSCERIGLLAARVFPDWASCLFSTCLNSQ